MKPKKDDSHGEGNYKAAREFDAAETAFVKSGRVEQAARDAAPKTPAEAAELEKAEAEARSRARDEDPALRREAVRLLELDLAVESDVDAEPGHDQRHLGGKGLAAGDRSVGDRTRHRLFDLALRADADHLQEFADAQIEGFFVHRGLLIRRARRPVVVPIIRRKLRAGIGCRAGCPPAP